MNKDHHHFTITLVTPPKHLPHPRGHPLSFLYAPDLICFPVREVVTHNPPKSHERNNLIQHKGCTKCRRYLPLSDFNKSRTGRLRRTSHCKDCLSDDARKRAIKSLKDKVTVSITLGPRCVLANTHLCTGHTENFRGTSRKSKG